MSRKPIMITALSFLMLAATAVAQTTPPPSPNEGAYDKLSPGNQKIVRALVDAEHNNSAPATTTPLSRDDIAAMKQNGKGWGGIFKELKSQGLVQEKNLGQVVSGANHTARSTSNGTVITSGSGRSYVAGTKMKPESTGMGAGTNGNAQRPQFTEGHGSLASGAGAGNSNAGGHGGRGRN